MGKIDRRTALKTMGVGLAGAVVSPLLAVPMPEDKKNPAIYGKLTIKHQDLVLNFRDSDFMEEISYLSQAVEDSDLPEDFCKGITGWRSMCGCYYGETCNELFLFCTGHTNNSLKKLMIPFIYGSRFVEVNGTKMLMRKFSFWHYAILGEFTQLK